MQGRQTSDAQAAQIWRPLAAKVGVAVAARARAMQSAGWDINLLRLLRQDCQWLSARADIDLDLATSAEALTMQLDPRLRLEVSALNEAVEELARVAGQMLARLPSRRPLRGDPMRAETPPLEFVVGRIRRAHAAIPAGNAPVAVAPVQRETNMDNTAPPPQPAAARAQGSPSSALGLGAVRRVYHLSDASVLSCELDAWLDAAGAELETLTAADELLELLGALPPDLVIVDAGHDASLEAIGEAVHAARLNPGVRLQWAAMFTGDDLATRLRARRAGVDIALFAAASVSDVVHAIFDVSAAAPFRVLIVEDDRAQATFAESVLRNAGMEVRVVEDPLSVMQTLTDFAPDLVLMDLHMPKCNGMELTALIRERPEHVLTPIVFLSGESDEDIQFEVIGAGADDFIAKPVRPRHLIAAVQNRIQRARASVGTADAEAAVQAAGAASASGLLHRDAFMQELRSVVNAATAVGGLAFVEVDGARRMRDRFGLAAVEALLAEAASVLRANIPEQALAARLGDASFLVLDRASAGAQLEAWALALRAAVMQHPFVIDDTPMRLRVSIGLCEFASVAADAGVVLNAAERAIRDARSDERGVARYVPPKSEHEQAEETIESALRSALVGEGLEFAFQPIVAVQGGEEAQFQCLLRLRQADAEPLPAAKFVPLAERRGLVAQVDQRAAAAAMRHIRERSAAERPVRLFLTQSPVSLASVDYERWMEAQLETQPLPQESLVIELRLEQAAIHAETISAFCGVLVRRGIGFCLSQFEAGSDAYALLDRLPLSYIKLGTRYLKAASIGAIKDELQEVVAAAHRRGIQVIAHRVEDPQAAAALWMVGIDLLQGNLVQGVGGGLDFDFRSAVL